MKKTLTALLLMAGCALASPVQFDTLTGGTTINGFTMTDGVITGSTEAPLYTHHSGANGGNTSNTIASTAVAITLNLSAIQADIDAKTLKDQTSLITFDTNGTDVGIYIQSTGNLIGQWGTGTNGSETAYNTWKTNNTTFVNSNGDTCLTLAVVMDVTTSWGGNGGIKAYDSEGGSVFSHNTLGSSSNTAVSSIILNTKYITNALVCSEVPTENIPAWAVALIPEPSTATLSLLALAGLAARRRRR